MKKTMFYVLAALALTACGSKKSETAVSDTQTPVADENVYYEGVLPAADADGVRYSLTLDYDDENPNKGDYKLTETYLKGDGTAISSFLTEGDFDVKTGTSTDPNARYLVMVPDVEDGAAPGQNLYFLAETDSTLTLVSADLTKSVNPELNYTITRVANLQR